VHPVHGSTVDRPFKTKGYVIRAARARSDGPGRVRAGCGGGARRELAGAAPGRVVGHHFACKRALRVAERHAHSSRGSGRWIKLPRRPTPEGGSAGFVGVRVPVLRCVLKGKTARKMMLTTRGNVGRAHGRRGGSSDGVRRRRRLGRRSGRRGPELQTLHDPGGGFPWTTSIA
jgi:hypothetical protein